ncbi:hypothetical protein Cgig2_013163 [Carnegiea gigantea]|uniref:Cytochrome P450 n=1 Tax=Carnegiea gigantea TaxID=171969 RepID=A0A9Q1KMR9_9CARY|nr:hypothetical protein Cgig2_013163 [Carnegiea gigantea]
MSTTAITLEWALTEIPCHPKKITQAQAEIDQVLGKGQARSIEESDISNLPYTKAIVKETSRLPSTSPLFVWVNVWSIYRVPSVWANPKSFVPERFLESEIDLKDRNFELVPFGTGRRMCPGMSLTHRMVHLMLATLHSFNWKLDHGLDPEDVIWKRIGDSNFQLTYYSIMEKNIIQLLKYPLPTKRKRLQCGNFGPRTSLTKFPTQGSYDDFYPMIFQFLLNAKVEKNIQRSGRLLVWAKNSKPLQPLIFLFLLISYHS